MTPVRQGYADATSTDILLIDTDIDTSGRGLEQDDDFWIGGTLSYVIYIIVVWGFTKAPIPTIGALRETSIFFSIFIGYFFLKEKITPTKIFSIIFILAGVVGLKLF